MPLPNQTFDMETGAGDGGKGDLMCMRVSDSYGVEIGRVVQTALIAMIAIATADGGAAAVRGETHSGSLAELPLH
jgi:hypothetical protein